MAWLMKKSPWIVHYNASSCNGCDLELVATLTPMYDPERFGVINMGNPKHADILLVTGRSMPGTRRSRNPLRPDAFPEGRGRRRHLRHLGLRLPGGLQRARWH